MKHLFILTLLTFSSASFACSDLLNSNLRVLDSDDEKNLCEYSGNVVLVVNVASRCGYTPQYAAAYWGVYPHLLATLTTNTTFPEYSQRFFSSSESKTLRLLLSKSEHANEADENVNNVRIKRCFILWILH